MTTPTPRDIELATKLEQRIENYASNLNWHFDAVVAVIAEALATARAEGEAAGAAREREACAKVAESVRFHTQDGSRAMTMRILASDVSNTIAEGIRARSQGAPDAKPE